jgi:cyclopropane-fatty-acyl-phospholipid synthase
MSSQSLSVREGWFGELLLAIGARLLPREITGGLTLTMPSGSQYRIGYERPGVSCDLQLKNYYPVWASIRRGAVGFSEAYLGGHWESSDVTALLRFYLQNRHQLDRAGRPVFFKSLGDRLWHLMRANSRRGARRNISDHYDLGNDFYRQWLDPTMSYSAGYFGAGAQSLEASQVAKYRLVLDTLDIKPGGRILEIGCGWGGFMDVAADAGHHVTGLTISREQQDYAEARLAGKSDVRFEDYRDSAGEFDAVASIEMIEAVGEANWPAFFEVIRNRLRSGGCAAVQAITMDERFYPDYRSSTDFIQRYIFPGGMLPTRTILAEQAARAGLGFETIKTFGQDYARTLAMWRERFEASWQAIASMGFDDAFRRRWSYYLSYCEAGFADSAVDVGIYRFRRLT